MKNSQLSQIQKKMGNQKKLMKKKSKLKTCRLRPDNSLVRIMVGQEEVVDRWVVRLVAIKIKKLQIISSKELLNVKVAGVAVMISHYKAKLNH